MTLPKQEMQGSHPEQRLSTQCEEGDRQTAAVPPRLCPPRVSSRPRLCLELNSLSGQHGFLVFENYMGFLSVALRIPSTEKIHWGNRPSITHGLVTYVISVFLFFNSCRLTLKISFIPFKLKKICFPLLLISTVLSTNNFLWLSTHY